MVFLVYSTCSLRDPYLIILYKVFIHIVLRLISSLSQLAISSASSLLRPGNVIRITRFCTFPSSSVWYRVIELPKTSQLYFKIELIRSMYILIKSTGGIPLRHDRSNMFILFHIILESMAQGFIGLDSL